MRTILFLLFSIAIYAQSFTVYTGSYTGSGGDDSTIVVNSGTDLTASGKSVVVIVKSTTTTYAVFRTDAHTGDASSYMYPNTGELADAIQAFTSTGFQIGTNAVVNTKDNTYNYTVIYSDEDYLLTTTYTGDGNNGRTVDCGFAPGMVWIRRAGATSDFMVWRTDVFGADSCIHFKGLLSTTGIRSFSGNNITLGTATAVNGDGNTYYLIAFKTGDYLATFRYLGTGSAHAVNFGKTLTDAYFVNTGKEADNTSNVWKSSSVSGTTSFLFTNAGGGTTYITAFDNSTMTVGTHAIANASGARFYAFALGNYTAPVVTAATTARKFKAKHKQFKNFIER